VKPAEAAALKAALEAAQIEMVPLSALVKSPLNVAPSLSGGECLGNG
jgi:ParB family chromosome partitioning protein